MRDFGNLPRLVLLTGVTTLIVCAPQGCAGPDLPDAPQVPRTKRTPLPLPSDFGDEPFPSPSVIPEPPRDGKLIRSGTHFLEFLATRQSGRDVLFAFPYDNRLAGIKGKTSDGSATLGIDGASKSMTPFVDEEGAVVFYVFPTRLPSAARITIVAKVKGFAFDGAFSHP